ncbi:MULTISPECIES: ABC transporter ATP-binding protein [Polaromonas]|uniref:ABC transporter ATP-binding protein n=1 Tax=Polaromonas aquatica TaxID=332657 RepID=A0ABW1U3F0_9BURK
MTHPALQGIALSRRYGGFAALRDVNLSVPAGEIRGLIGPNGAGKSTLIDVLSGRAKQWSGQVLVDGQDIGACSSRARRKLGMARSFQRTSIFPTRTVRDQLELASHWDSGSHVDEVLAQLNLAEFQHQPANELSYGDQRRLDLALALIGRPRVLLLDEPAAGLTMQESLDLAHLLRDLVKRWGITVLLVEHDMDVVFSICDRITVLNLGELLVEGSAQEVRTSPLVISAYLGRNAA